MTSLPSTRETPMEKTQTATSNIDALGQLRSLSRGLARVEADAAIKRAARNDYVRKAADQGHSLSSIAEVVGISKAAVHKIVQKATRSGPNADHS